MAEGDWGVTTAVEPPEGFVSDYPELTADGNMLDVLQNDTHSHAKRPLTVTAVTTPGHGSATITDEGLLTDTPDAGFVGEDSLVYRMVDATGAESTATVTIDVKGSGNDQELAPRVASSHRVM